MFLRLFWNPAQRRLRLVWRMLGALLILFMVSLLLGLVAGLLGLTGPLGIPNTPGVDQRSSLVNQALLTLLIVLVSLWLATRLLDHRLLADLGLHINRGWLADLAWGLALGALLMTLIFVTEWVAGWLSVRAVFYSAPGTAFLSAFLGPLVLFLCVGFYEELTMRGYLIRNLSEGLCWRRIGPRTAMLLAWLASSIVFGLAHAPNPNATLGSTMSLMLAGLFMGLGYVLTGELAFSIGLHIAWNLFQGNVYGFPVSGLDVASQATVLAIAQSGPSLWTGGAFGPEAGLLGNVAGLLGALLTLLWARRRTGRLALDISLVRYAPPARPAPLTPESE